MNLYKHGTKMAFATGIQAVALVAFLTIALSLTESRIADYAVLFIGMAWFVISPVISKAIVSAWTGDDL